MTRSEGSSIPTRNPAGTWWFWCLVSAVTTLDAVTKNMAVDRLTPRHVPHPIIGDVVRFTLAYNPGAAFGMHLGPASRWIFAALSIVIVTVLLRATADLTRVSRMAAMAVPVIIGGAFGNLLDRIRQHDGVVDFIDIGVGTVRFWTFNVADAAVTVGAIGLILALWRVEQAEKQRLSPTSPADHRAPS